MPKKKENKFGPARIQVKCKKPKKLSRIHREAVNRARTSCSGSSPENKKQSINLSMSFVESDEKTKKKPAVAKMQAKKVSFKGTTTSGPPKEALKLASDLRKKASKKSPE